MMRLMALCLILAAICLAAPAAAQGATTDQGAAASPVKVVTSIHPISALVREVGGDAIEVSTIIPAGADPHHFELTPGKARALHEAKVIMLIGGHFDEWILPRADEPEGIYMVVRFSEAFTDSLIPLGDSFNPHFWLDPMFAREMTRIIAVALCTVDFGNCEHYRARAAALIADLDELRIAGRSGLAASGFETFVALHPAWTYFAERYGLTELATLETTHESEPSARHIADVISRMGSDGVRFVIAEEFSGLDLARLVAEETGSKLVLLDPLGDEDTPGRDTYAGLMNHNLNMLKVSAEHLKESPQEQE